MTAPEVTRRERLVVALGATCFVFLLALHAVFLYANARRVPDWDEAEYLHGAWLISRGQRLYRDFFEHHAPQLYVILGALRPDATSAAFPVLDVPRWLERARLVVGSMGTLGVVAASSIAARVSRRPSAAILTTAAVLGSKWTWERGVTDARNDPPALMLFWLGALLVTWRRDASRAAAVRAGLGVGCLLSACAWNPKWPLTTLAIVGFGVVEAVRVARGGHRTSARTEATRWGAALVAVLGFVAVNVAVITRLTTLLDYRFYVFTLNGIIRSWNATSNDLVTWFHQRGPETYCSPLFWPTPIVAAWALVVLAVAAPRARRAWRHLDVPLAVFVLVLTVVAGAEGLWLAGRHPWPQHYLVWSYSGAMVLALLPGALLALYEGHVRSLTTSIASGMELVLASSATVIGCLAVADHSPDDARYYWAAQGRLQARLAPEDRVWVRPDEHPIAAFDATYYWFAFQDLIPAMVTYTTAHPDNGFLPVVHDEASPLCRAVAEPRPSLRLAARRDEFIALPRTYDCYRLLSLADRLELTDLRGTVWVKPAAP